MPAVVTRLELSRIRVCRRCGRGGAELRGPDGTVIVIPLDGARARELRDGTGTGTGADVPSWVDVVLGLLGAAGRDPRDVVLDVADDRLRGLVSLGTAGEPEVVGCTPEEGVTLALRAGLKLYATDEAIAHAAARSGRGEGHGEPGDTLH